MLTPQKLSLQGFIFGLESSVKLNLGMLAVIVLLHTDDVWLLGHAYLTLI